MLEEHGWCVEPWSCFLRGVTRVCVTLEQILLSHKLLQSCVRVENL